MDLDDWPLMKDGDPFPEILQGRWIEESEPTYEVIIRGHELFMRGELQDYVERRISITNPEIGAVSVTRPFDTEFGDELDFYLLPGDELYIANNHAVGIFRRAV